MAKDNSFDIVSEPDWGEVSNAVEQTRREFGQRYDFRGQNVELDYDRSQKQIKVNAPAGMVLDAAVRVVEEKMARRNISLRFLDIQPPTMGGGDRGEQIIALKSGIATETAKAIQKFIRGLGVKVTAEIQGEALRVTGKSRDDLQQVIQAVKAQDFGLELAFSNYR